MSDSILEAGIKQIHEDLTKLPEGTRGAFVATANSKGTITISVATKLEHGWSIGAGLQGRLNKTVPDAYVGVMKTW